MALLPDIHIEMGIVEATFCHQVEVVSSWQMLTDTCTIQMPRKVARTQGRTLNELVKAGDQVRVMAGYSQQLDLIFEGSIRQVNPTIPFVVECEDPMMQLKRGSITKSWASVSLQQLTDHIAPGIPNRVLDADLGKFQVERITPARILDELKGRGLFTFFRNSKLQVGRQYDPETATRHRFSFHHNIVEDESSLEWVEAENLFLKVKAISIGTDNRKTVVEVGDPDGDERTMHFFNLSDKELKAAAERELERMKYDGYRGSFKTFGQPTVHHGDIVELIDPTYPEREGSFWVDKVVRTYGMDGYWQEITLGPATR